MKKRIILVFVCLFLFKVYGFAFILSETDNAIFSLDSYLRTDVTGFKNTVDLDSANKDDNSVFLGIDYSLGFRYEHKNSDLACYLRFERNGPGDYSAPLFAHNTLMTSGGVIEEYRDDELLPQIEECWLEAPLNDRLFFKTGLYTYEVGKGFSLNGSYENYGLTFAYVLEDLVLRIYYCRPDVVYKNHLGPRIRQDEEQEYKYEHNASNFFATDVKINMGKNTFWPYIGVLADHTSPDKRYDLFTSPVKRDILGTAGFSWDFAEDNWSWSLELARNFGYAESADADYKDITHTGYLIFAQTGYSFGRLTPSFELLVASGNKTPSDAADDTTLTSGKNRAFSSYSPLNMNLGDSISACNVDSRPVVAMGCGYGLQYGVPRPGTLATSDFDNLIMPILGLEYGLNDKLSLGLDVSFMRSFEKSVATLNGENIYLSRDLGREIDMFIDYQLNENTLVSFLGGYFFPGKYYKENRDDVSGSLFNPYVRGDGSSDYAYQLELSLEFKF
ncbi:MAG: hypothetical protein JW788_04195 [Candidatus Omnitrophica bacterium]|nr:hypothetical protein [Candidatus Omnitrophota bacterium]